MRARSQVVGLTLLVAALLGVSAPAALGAEFVSAGDGTWSDPSTWTSIPGGAPGPTDTAVITGGDTVTLDASATSAGVTVSALGTLDLSTHGLSVAGDATLESTAAVQGGPGALVVTGRLTISAATITNTNITVASDAGSTPSTRFSAGATSTWTGSTLSQVGGASEWLGHVANGVDPSFDHAAITVAGHNESPGGMTLSASSQSGTLAFTPPAADAPGDAAQLALGDLTSSGTQTVTVDWTGYSAQHGDRANLVSTTTGSPTGLTATNTAATTFTADTGILFARFSDFANSGSPSVSSNNAVNTAEAAAGDVLTCDPGTWTETATYAYVWRRGGTVVSGQTASTYTVTDADLGKTVTCAVTATASHVSLSADASNSVSVPVAPSVSIAAPAVITSPTATVGYTLGAGTRVTSCALNGRVLFSCASPIALSDYPNGAASTLTVNARNSVGATTTATATFNVRIAPTLSVDPQPAAAGGEPVTLAIRADADADVACRYVGAAVPCDRAGVTIIAPPAGRTFTLAVTATTPQGSTTVSREITSTTARAFPSPVSIPVGRSVTLPSTAFLGRGPASAGYSWDGPLRVAWTGSAADPASWGVQVTAPKTPGRYRQTLSWYAEPGALNSITAQVFDPDTSPATRMAGGVTSRKAALTCPAAGSPAYQWWADDELLAGQTKRALPASAVPANASVWCTARNTTTGAVTVLRVLVDRRARFAALPKGTQLRVQASDAASVRVIARRGKRKLTTVRAKVRRGTTSVRVPKAATTFELRRVRSGGATSRPLTITRP